MRDSSAINSFCILFIDSSVSPSNLRTSFGVVLDALKSPHPSSKFTLNPSIKILSPTIYELARKLSISVNLVSSVTDISRTGVEKD